MARPVPYHTTCTDATIGRFDPSSSPAQLIDVFIAMLKPMCQLLIVTCVGSAMLVPLFVLLWFSSNSETRRKPIFIANVVSIVIGLAFAGVSIAQIVRFRSNCPHLFANKVLVITVAEPASCSEYTAIPYL